MSRCFPFPPPGYERKHGRDDLDLLKKAKHKEKKYKKEKDEERKKEKDKKKDESGEKQKDKKDRKKHRDKKEKHKDKKDKNKKKEDRSKDKEKSSISEESTVSGVKLNGKLLPEGHSKDKSHAVDERKHPALFQGQNGQNPSQGVFPLKGNEVVQELGKRIRDDGARGSQLRPLVDERDQKIAAKAVVGNSSALLVNEKGNEKGKGVDNKSLVLKKIGNASRGNSEIEVDRIVRPLDDQKNGKLESKEKLKEIGEAKVGEKRKDRDKKSHGKEKDKEKEKKKKKKEKKKEKSENKKSSKEVKLGEIEGNAFASVVSNKSTGLLNEVNNSGELDGGNNRKRKDMCTNGFGHETEITANKIQRHAPLPPPHHESIENGRKLEPCPTPIKSHDEHAIPNSVTLDIKSPLVNGVIEGQEPFPPIPPHNSSAVISREQVPAVPKIRKSKSISSKEKPKLPNIEDLIAEALKRPPHPDSKYLSEVLTIPNVAGLSENDEDQEWLFRKKDPLDKPKDELVRAVDKDLRVWSEAVRIESADICALPYVIPY